VLVTFASVAFPHSGLGARARAVIEDLTALGIDLTVLSVGEPSGAQIVLEQGAVRLISVSRVRSAHWSIQLARRLSRLRRDCDVVIAESALLMPSIMLARWKGPLVWGHNELETLHYRRLPQIWSNRWRGWVWQVLERWAVQRADVVVSISEAESIWWHRLFPQVGPKLAVVDHRSPVASLGSKPRGHSACLRMSPARLVLDSSLSGTFGESTMQLLRVDHRDAGAELDKAHEDPARGSRNREAVA